MTNDKHIVERTPEPCPAPFGYTRKLSHYEVNVGGEHWRDSFGEINTYDTPRHPIVDLLTEGLLDFSDVEVLEVWTLERVVRSDA